MSAQNRKPLPATREVPEIPEGQGDVFLQAEGDWEEEISTAKGLVSPVSKVATAERSCPHLVLLFGRGIGQVFKLDKDEIQVGRERGCEIQFADTGISRRHMAIARDSSGGFTLRDLGSRNGTFLNERRIDGPQPLHHNDLIHIGSNTVLKFIDRGNLEVDYALSMYDAAVTDALTGVYNRRYLEEQLVKELAFARRHGMALAVILMDLDHFKQINDTTGHQVGDQVLTEFTALIGKSIRVEDTFGRYGGEEFAILCRHTGPSGAAAKAERIRQLTAGYVFCRETYGLRMTVSIGVAAFDTIEEMTHQAMLAYADEALYQAKEAGRDRVVLYREG